MSANPGSPNEQLVRKVQDLWREVDELGKRWIADSLNTADPAAQDLDAYVRPLITIAELLRRQRLPDLSRHVYERAIDIVNRHCDSHMVDLHRGALYANYAIAQFEIGRYTQALSWSYAFTDEGIFGQWLKSHFIPALPADVAQFITNSVGVTVTEADVRSVVRWLAGRGDLSLFSGVVEYAAVGSMNDYHAQAVRLTCVRDLATLLEVLLKMLGEAHKDPAVVSAFAQSRTLAPIICHMHFAEPLKKRRANPAMSAHRTPGLFQNTQATWPGLVSSIDAAIDFCASNPPDQVLAYLKEYRPLLQ